MNKKLKKKVKKLLKKTSWGKAFLKNRKAKRIREEEKALGLEPVEETAIPQEEISEQDKNCYISAVAEKAGWTYAQAKERMDDARKRAGVYYRDYSKYDFYQIPEDQQRAKFKEILIKREKKAAKNAKVEEITAQMGPRNPEGGKHPTPVIAACYHLGQPLPTNAVVEKQPSHYLGTDWTDGTLDSIKALLGDKMPYVDAEELGKTFRSFKIKFRSQKNLTFNNADLVIYFCDWLLYAKDRGFSHNDYFDYEMYYKEPDVRDTFLNEGYRNRVYAACNKPKQRRLLSNKAKFNKKFSRNVRREWIDASVCEFEEFKKYVEAHDTFFGKPVRGTGGAGARVIKRDDYTLPELFAICKQDELILEELIRQHPSLSAVNESTLNTVRINTLLCADGEVRIMLAMARFGRAGNAVDNFHGGGVAATVDIDTGVIISEAINRAHVRSKVHPDSKAMLLGFRYPKWDAVKEAVCKAALKVPELRQIGWDVAVTETGEIEFVEGNSRPNFDALQSPDQVGRRFRYAPYIPEIEKLEGIDYKEPAPLVIDITGMERGE